MSQVLQGGKLIIVSAPSGAGKTTIVSALVEAFPELVFSVSACSRPPRHNEQHGKDYYFLSQEAFMEQVAAGDFVEWEEVYPGKLYGTLRQEVEAKLAVGKHIIFDVDVQGGLNIKKQFPVRALALFIMPPSIEALEQRLRARSTEDEQTLQVRLGKAREEMAQAALFDKIIVNAILREAIERATTEVRAFLESNPIHNTR